MKFPLTIMHFALPAEHNFLLNRIVAWKLRLPENYHRHFARQQ
jgi:hypothetical protein